MDVVQTLEDEPGVEVVHPLLVACRAIGPRAIRALVSGSERCGAQRDLNQARVSGCITNARKETDPQEAGVVHNRLIQGRVAEADAFRSFRTPEVLQDKIARAARLF